MYSPSPRALFMGTKCTYMYMYEWGGALLVGKDRHIYTSLCTPKMPFTSFVFVLCSSPLNCGGGPWHMEVPQGPGARVFQTEEEGSQAASKRHILHLGLWRTGTIQYSS